MYPCFGVFIGALNARMQACPGLTAVLMRPGHGGPSDAELTDTSAAAAEPVDGLPLYVASKANVVCARVC